MRRFRLGFGRGNARFLVRGPVFGFASEVVSQRVPRFSFRTISAVFCLAVNFLSEKIAKLRFSGVFAETGSAEHQRGAVALLETLLTVSPSPTQQRQDARLGG